ncbi:Cyclophilin type peptidyl-prolyl cis-trans isomerase/CLD [Ruminococcus sp. YE71]|uniref:peptidylprolyl isomerase n=1 Tax=unclassified Ruminococcus TaxID=2608920 RepID=UPI00088C261E|nr:MULTISPECIES: peptidylprolyl isomerase [unclassified Ruminococcus]SDA23738.1 Cyclophilin type peptidyl-prolyl cis-trans isomerase/CLD [Ruminococcus sp. YE78]SFW40398.1 Cyclophilin type peptidyl-prolyl cis-trans isomerase/CLD [Ruminococcus sp. YE71]
MKLLRRITLLTTAAAVICAVMSGCADKNQKAHSADEDNSGSSSKFEFSSEGGEDESGVITQVDGEVQSVKCQFDITIDGESVGSFVITTHPEYAPITCQNFQKLVESGFYDGLTFHRVIDGFMAQGGDPEGTGMGGSDRNIKGEFAANGVENGLSHTRGVVSMARGGYDMDSASSQFFICYDDCSGSLDGMYAAFGEVTEGMEVVDKFLDVERVTGSDGYPSSPTKPIVITKATVID